MSDENESTSENAERAENEERSLQLSDELKKLIKKSIEEPVILPK